jgi:hypothetical protein
MKYYIDIHADVVNTTDENNTKLIEACAVCTSANEKTAALSAARKYLSPTEWSECEITIH